jgi:hypothetical protein
MAHPAPTTNGLPFVDPARGDLRMNAEGCDDAGAYAPAAAAPSFLAPSDAAALAPCGLDEALVELQHLVPEDMRVDAPTNRIDVTFAPDGAGFTSVRAALAACRPPCEVRVGPGLFWEGRLRVPEGVVLRGAGRRRTVLFGTLDLPANSAAVALTLRTLDGVPIRARGDGIAVVDVEVWPLHGIPIGIDATGSVRVAGCHVHDLRLPDRSTPAQQGPVAGIRAGGSHVSVSGSLITGLRSNRGLTTGIDARGDVVMVRRCVVHELMSHTSVGINAVIRQRGRLEYNTVWRCGHPAGSLVTGIAYDARGGIGVDDLSVRGNLTGALFATLRQSGGANVCTRSVTSLTVAHGNCGYLQIWRAPGPSAPSSPDAERMRAMADASGPGFRDAAVGDLRPAAAAEIPTVYGAYAAARDDAPDRLLSLSPELPGQATADMPVETLLGLLERNEPGCFGPACDALAQRYGQTVPAERGALARAIVPALSARAAKACPQRAAAADTLLGLYAEGGAEDDLLTPALSALREGDAAVAETIGRRITFMLHARKIASAPDRARTLAALELFILGGEGKERAFTVSQVHRIGAEAVPMLVKALSSPSFPVRANAVHSLGEIGPAARDALPHLKRLAQQPQKPGYESDTLRSHLRTALAAIERDAM